MVYDLPKLNQDVINNLSQSITSNAFVVVIYNQVPFTKQLLSDCLKMEIKLFLKKIKTGKERKSQFHFPEEHKCKKKKFFMIKLALFQRSSDDSTFVNSKCYKSN